MEALPIRLVIASITIRKNAKRWGGFILGLPPWIALHCSVPMAKVAVIRGTARQARSFAVYARKVGTSLAWKNLKLC